MKKLLLAIACLAMVVATAGQIQADVIITYQDFGSDLKFNFSGSMNVATPTPANGPYATASLQAGSHPLFYSASTFGFAGTVSSVTHTPGPFATNLPAFAAIQGTHSGTSFLFRLPLGNPGPASSLDLYGNWGAANSPINGQLILTGQSAAGIGMVDGWNVETDWGTISFEAVPEPASLAIFAIGALGLVVSSRRRKAKVNLV